MSTKQVEVKLTNREIQLAILDEIRGLRADCAAQSESLMATTSVTVVGSNEPILSGALRPFPSPAPAPQAGFGYRSE